ncbi:winged helix-turn-helix transcriptional regulator [Halococcus sediminicola]|uniref:winged helix-turn-helix transcriptional regulator n=1 Tax=Halococcus sediminicola TaxID=1264579 RepID=UPI000678F777|nr:winged helix-turn-helix transcriptional regulator [Halococcus sediminicola]
MTELATNKTDRRIAEELQKGRNLPSNLAKDLGLTRQYVQDRMKRLREHGVVTNIGNGLYELNDEWRAYFASLEEPPADFPIGGVVDERLAIHDTTHDHGANAFLIVGTPEQTYGEWCKAHGTEPGGKWTFETENIPGDKTEIPVVEVTQNKLIGEEGEGMLTVYGLFRQLVDDGMSVEEAAGDAMRDGGIIGVPASDIELYKEPPSENND